MKLTGTVKNGKVAVKLPEGTSVAIEVVRDYPLGADGRVMLTPEQEELELRIGIAEADAGLVVPARQVLAELRADSRAFLKSKRRAKPRGKRSRG